MNTASWRTRITAGAATLVVAVGLLFLSFAPSASAAAAQPAACTFQAISSWDTGGAPNNPYGYHIVFTRYGVDDPDLRAQLMWSHNCRLAFLRIHNYKARGRTVARYGVRPDQGQYYSYDILAGAGQTQDGTEWNLPLGYHSLQFTMFEELPGNVPAETSVSLISG